MKHFVLLFTLATLSYAQSPYTAEPPSQIVGVPGPRWNGPYANHVPGQVVGDTAEVAAAKAALYQAYKKALEVLPPLPPQERYQMTGINFVHPPQPVYHNNPTHIQNNFAHEPTHTSSQFTQYAEEIPRSEIGEVPEVDAARKAHLAAYEEIRKLLPKQYESTTYVPVVPQPQYNHAQYSNPQNQEDPLWAYKLQHH